eukprot:CAMPEP_0202924918 /NCGR_PEP_ID=MMETSP1392-20130828/79227_1 /ASSEMBLY_ACC=CAM_ASM_000868 /TAXON_ID=225041 /ORGANISM="Chlamydomonas chlamydogama, Strain SAG 11-48b" /LENGTH=475 /DNA_ID=CAMNT_0049618675 /DNA_START=90 /DNA_END=1517 /DNA_ORIENTATION=+
MRRGNLLSSSCSSSLAASTSPRCLPPLCNWRSHDVGSSSGIRLRVEKNTLGLKSNMRGQRYVACETAVGPRESAESLASTVQANNVLNLGDNLSALRKDVEAAKIELGYQSDDEDCEAGGCFTDWGENGFWDNPSPVRAQLLEIDPGLNQSLISSATTVAQIFNQDLWEKHRKPERYFTNLRTILASTVLRRIMKPIKWLTGIALFTCAYNTAAQSMSWVQLGITTLPHTLLGAALSLLLVFRTNGCFARFQEGRVLWGQLIRSSRDWIRLAANYFPEASKKKAARYVQVLAFVLKSHLRSGRTRKDTKDRTAFRDDPSEVVRDLLPEAEAELLLAAPNKPFFAVCRMTQILKEADHYVPHHVRHHLEHVLADMLQVAGGCDRILGTPVPLSYTRHTSRSLMLWLMTLPFALWPQAGWLSVPAMMVISFIFVGIDEIGVEIEEPFAILPLLPLCRTISNDVKMVMGMPGSIAAYK